MKLENIEPLGRPQSDTVIVQLMTVLGVSKTAMPKRFGKQNNACIFMTKIACHNAHTLNIYHRK